MSAQLQAAPGRRAMLMRDVEAVAGIEATAYSHPWTRGNFIDSLAAGYLAEVLVDDAAGIVGYFVAMPGVDELHLLNITVAPAWQCRGHGRHLLHAVLALARQRDLASVWLEVRQGNLRAQALYRRMGFVESGLRRAYYPALGGREDAVVMSITVPVQDAP
ncbi:MAG TPA: ribosomal protein S18-alanine N-acetyltransferase [Rubrivivax sp.]|jgi:ribosomal-protein-alanine N-acetyltransferase|nr:ribosomal protein S18-alanine N-acetyltransferase [Rubrivivax sp.]